MLLISCSDFIVDNIQDDYYNSIYLNGGTALQFSNNIDGQYDDGEEFEDVEGGTESLWDNGEPFTDFNYFENGFTIEIFISSGAISTTSSSAIASFLDSNGSIVFGLHQDPQYSDRIKVIINDQINSISSTSIDNLNWLSDSFYLVSIWVNDNQIKVSVNGENDLVIDKGNLDFSELDLFIGASGNRERTVFESVWRGYIDEARVWITPLSENIRMMHYKNPSKLSETSDTEANTFLDSLRGIWRFNTLKSNPLLSDINKDGSGFNNTISINTLSGFNIELSEKGIN